jgi:hypothetical protein
MTDMGAALVYFLCLLASVLCAGLLLRSWQKSRSRLLLWTASAFVLLALNNLLLVADRVIFPDVYLWPYRQVFALGAVAVLIYGFIWEVER